LGIAEEELNTNDEYALRQFDDKVHFINGRYKVGLIWKPFHPALQSNRVSAEKRQSRVTKRLEANPSLQLEYEKMIQEFICCEYVEEAR
jgi:23S rRNA A1618 N6-methylase RlmF